MRASTSTYLIMRRRRIKIVKISTILLIVAVLIVSGDFLWSLTVKWLDQTPWGRLQIIEVRGIDRLPRELIINCANLPMGISLFYYPIEMITLKIDGLPGVKKTQCFRRIPGKLIIKVDEREPIMAIASKQITLMDIDGIKFMPVGIFETVDVPFITSTNGVFRRKDFESSQELLIDIYQNYRTLYQHLGEIRSNRSGLCIILREGGAEVILHDKLNAQHLEILDAFLGQKSTTLPPDLRYVDLRFDRMVIIGTDKRDT